MKKLSILMSGVLLAVLILQGCAKDPAETAPTKDQSTVTPPKDITPLGSRGDMIPLGVIPMATGEGTQSIIQSALAVGSVQPMIDTNSDGIVDTVYRSPDRSWGLSSTDVLAVGQGIDSTGYGCPVTGVCNCTIVAGTLCRGDNVGGVMSANIRLTNNTAAGGIGACAQYANSICKNDTDCYPNATGAALAFECTFPVALVGADGIYGTGDDGPVCGADGICGVPFNLDDPVDWDGADNLSNTGDEPNPGTNCSNAAVPGNPGVAATAGAGCLAGTVCTDVNELGVLLGGQQRYCLGQIITDNAAGHAVGYCLNGYTTCNDNAIAGDGIAAVGIVTGKIFTACGAGTCSITVTKACLVNADCGGVETCVGAAPIGSGSNAATCWTGCGPIAAGIVTAAPDCIPGRNLNCVQVRWDGSQAAGTTYVAATATTYPKCTQAAAYAPVGYNNQDLTAWLAGSIPLAGPGSAVVNLQIAPYDPDYCVHYFSVHEMASGDAAGCTATCGDGWVATTNGEICEPIDNGTNTDTEIGCPVGQHCTPGTCGSCFVPVATCGNGALDVGEQCDFAAPLLDNCCSAVCQFTVNGAADPQAICAGGGACVNAVCDGLGGCALANKANGTVCNAAPVGACDTQDTCLAGICNDNVAAAATNCGAAPAPPCDPQDTCDGVLKTCPANLAGAGTPCAGNGVSAPCTAADTCDGLGVCNNNDAAALTPCGGELLDTCDNDACAAGVCVAGVPSADGTACVLIPNVPGTDTCCTSVCTDTAVPGICVGKVITSVVPIKGTSAGYADPAKGDYNNGQTGGGAALWYVIIPNDPTVTAHGKDWVESTVNFSAALVGGDTVTCTVSPGALPLNSLDCGAGDVSCRVFGNHPEVTGGGIVTDAQTEGAVGGLFPDEADTATLITVSCVLNANPAVTAVGNMAMGFVGARDELKAAGVASNFELEMFVYCANGATQICNDLQGGGNALIGLNAHSTVIHFNPAVITGFVNHGAMGGQVDGIIRNNGTGQNYGVPTGGVCATTSQACGSCNAGGMPAGSLHFDGACVICQGWLMADMGSCTLTYAATAAGTFSKIDLSAFSADMVEIITGNMGMPIRGYDGGTGNPLPSTNVSMTLAFQ